MALSKKRSNYWITFNITCFFILFSLSCDESTSLSNAIPGMDWEIRSTGVASNLYSVAWSGNVYAAVGDSTVFISSDGYEWQKTLESTSGEINDILWDGDKFIAVGENRVFYSFDGYDWSADTVEINLMSISCYDKLIVAAADSNRALVSNTFANWSIKALQFQAYDFILRSASEIWGVGENWNYIKTSGTNWNIMYTDLEDTSNGDGFGISVSGTKFVMVGEGGKIIIGPNSYFPSPGWKEFYPGEVTSNNLFDITNNGDLWISVGENGTIIVLDSMVHYSDSISIAQRVFQPQPVTDLDLYGVVWTGLGFLAVGESGVVLSSPPR